MKQILFILTLTLVFTACQNSDQNDNISDESTEKQEDGYEDYVSLVDKLRLRETPSLKGKVLYSFKEGEEMLFTGNKSENRDKITIRGKEISENWFEIIVKSDPDIKGWIFGGAIGKKGEKSNIPKARKKKKYTEISASEIEGIIEVKGVKDYGPYGGYYSYYLTSNGVKVKDGFFEFYTTNTEDIFQVKYSGKFTNGIKDSVFIEEYTYDNIQTGKHTSKLFFNENGNCTKIHHKGKSSRVQSTYDKVINTNNCTFSDFHEQFIKEYSDLDMEPMDVAPLTRFSNESLVGSWTIIMKATSSDCPTTSTGDIVTESWLMSVKDNQLVARKAAGGENTVKEYTGYMYGDLLTMNNVRKWNSGGRVKIDFKIINSSYMKGTRIVSNTNPCTIIYEITAKKN